ncbi:MAG: hypothetical protein V1755_00965 [Chloroflexota bacterium]
MNLLLLKLFLTPALIGLASLAGRKWGHAVSGWIVALPLTTGPIIFFLALSHGAAFAADTAAGILAGVFSLVAFTIVYGAIALRWTWLPTLMAASAAFFVMTAILRPIHVPLVPLWAAVLAALLLSIRLLSRPADSGLQTQMLPAAWDIPLRMLIATGFVLLITGLAPAVGPHLAGLLSPFPLFTAILAAFAQHQHGAAAAVSVLRGLHLGLFSYASFMFTLALLLLPAGIPAAFAAAMLIVIVFQAASLRLLRRRIG